MHIAHLIDMLPTAGAQKLLVTFAHQARRNGDAVTVISLREKTRFHSTIPTELEEAGARVLYFPVKRLADPVRFFQLAWFLRRGQYDVLHTHLVSSNIFGGMAGRLIGLPVIVTLHSTGRDPRYAHYMRDQLEMWVLRHVNRVIAVGDSVKEAYSPLLRRQLDVIPNAVNEPIMLSPEQRIALRAQLTGEALRPILIGVGSLSPDKCFGDLLVAFSKIRTKVPGVALLIAGDGVEREHLFSQCQQLGLEGDVFWLGVRGDVPRLMVASDIYVSSSAREGLAIAMLEAMMVGLPMVVTSVGEAPRVAADDRGVLVPPQNPDALASALLQLLQDSERQQVLGMHARNYALQTYSADKWYGRLTDLYLEELQKGKQN